MLVRTCTLTVLITRRSCRTLLPAISVLFILLRTTTSMLNAILMFCVLRSQMIIFSKTDLISIVSVESVDGCIRNLKFGKACGPDGLCSEHLVNAHPLLVIHLCALFRGMILHGFVPDAFDFGIIVPLMKDKTGNANSLINYRGITLFPVISKWFEILLLEYFENALLTDDFQFGFQKGLGCSDAIFTLCETIEFF